MGFFFHFSMSYPTSAFLDSAFVQVDSLAGADSVVFFHKNRLGRRSVKMNFAPGISCKNMNGWKFFVNDREDP